MKVVNGDSQRWQSLYDLGKKKQEDRDIQKINYEKQKEQEESFPFKP